jgi:hypothetical protein
MKIIPFPRSGDPHDERSFDAQIDAALHRESGGAAGDSWRELRDDVRALATPMSPEFERRMRERIEQRAADDPRRAPRRSRSSRARAWLGCGLRPRVLAGLGICVTAAVVTLVIVAPWRGSSSQLAAQLLKPAIHGQADSSASSGGGAATPAIPQSAGGGAATPAIPQSAQPLSRPAKIKPTSKALSPTTVETDSTDAGASSSHAATSSAAGSGAESARARVQQRAASITLAATPEGVQSIADQVARLAVREGGFVRSSQVHLQHGADGEANLDLSLPSARLSAALASLAELAPTRAESQSLQDITDEYDSARRRLADAVAERRALLRALSRASAQGEIESLHARLSLAGGAITRARTALQSVSKRGSSSAVEVTVLGDAHASGGGLTLSSGLHDAGDVLRVALAVLIIALAVLLPLAALLAVLSIGVRAVRRHQRERALS